ncbi:MAG: ABC transporter ATP-binding protein [Clostridia bacterium]
MKKIISFLKPHKIRLIIGPLSKLIEAILELLLPTLVAIMIDDGIIKQDLPLIIKLGLVMIFLSIIGYLFSLICQYNASIVSTSFSKDLRQALFLKISSLSKVNRDKYKKETLTNRLTKDVNQLELAVAMLIRLVVRAPFICIGSIIMAFIINFKLSLILIIASVLFFILVFLIVTISLKIYNKYQFHFDKLSLKTTEFISSLRLVKSFTREGKTKKEFKEQNDNLYKSSKKMLKISALLSPITTLLMNIVIVLVLFFGGKLVAGGELDIGSIVAYVNYVTQLVVALIVVTNLVTLYIKASSSMQRVSEILNIENEPIKQLPTIKDDTNAVNLLNVSFKFDSKIVLEDINLTIKKGESIGILGNMGSGKTVLVNLILGLITPNTGDVTVNGYNTKTFSPAIKDYISLAPQKVSFLTGSILQNITLGNKNATQNEITRAIENAKATEIIDNLKDKYETKIEMGGKNFSGGEKQRLSLARAFIKNGELLIIDNSLNALDSKTYKEVIANIYKSCHTKIILSENISSIKNCDRLFILSNTHLKKATLEDITREAN